MSVEGVVLSRDWSLWTYHTVFSVWSSVAAVTRQGFKGRFGLDVVGESVRTVIHQVLKGLFGLNILLLL